MDPKTTVPPATPPTHETALSVSTTDAHLAAAAAKPTDREGAHPSGDVGILGRRYEKRQESRRVTRDTVDAAARLRSLGNRVRCGDQNASSRLLGEVVGLAKKAARRVLNAEADVEDVAQDVAIRIVDRLVELDKIDNLSAWVATVARRAAISVRRRHARVVLLPADLPTRPVVMVVDARLDVQRVLALLTERERLVVVRRFVDRCGLQEVADDLGVSLGQVTRTVEKARKRVLHHLAGTSSARRPAGGAGR